MRKLLLLALVLVLAAGVALPALAGGSVQPSAAPSVHTNAGSTQFSLQGDVTRVFTTARAMKVHVRLGSAGIRPFIGRELTMRVGRNAEMLVVSEGIARALRLGQIKPGQRVRVEGRIDRSASLAPMYVATLVHVRQWTPTAELTEFACGGKVTLVESAGVRLTVGTASRALWSSIGDEVAVGVPAEARLFTWVDGVKVPIALTDIVVDDRIWVRGTVDRASGAAVLSADVVVLRRAAATP
jgi:hypothetical protein